MRKIRYLGYFVFIGVAVNAKDCEDVTCSSSSCQISANDVYITSVSVKTDSGSKSCSLWKNFGWNGRYIWTDGGCSGTFEACYVAKSEMWCQAVACRSSGSETVCPHIFSGYFAIGRMTKMKKLSSKKCTFPDEYWFDGDDIHVTDGCQAVFKVCSVATCEAVTCNSKGSKNKCSLSHNFNAGSVELLRETSSSGTCVSASTFGTNGNDNIWVDGGCKGTFKVYYDM